MLLAKALARQQMYYTWFMKISAHHYGTVVLTLTFVTVLLIALPGRAWQQDGQKGSMPGMDMSGKGDTPEMDMSKEEMKSMGSSMAAMAGHMKVTRRWPKQPGDEEKANAVIAEAKATMERYKDYRKALADGYVILNPKVEQPQYHFNNDANDREADLRFDPTKPTSLLYYRTPHQSYKLEGVMYTARPHATEDELNQRIPLSIARWHEHINFCAAPASRAKEYLGAHPTFGMFGSIHAKEACETEGGTFYPVMFTWMIHVFPYENDFKDIFSMNDDVPHVKVSP
ncbi:MAG: hypothetical protein WB992_09090 [Bryobacteraceae bacterium]